MPSWFAPSLGVVLREITIDDAVHPHSVSLQYDIIHIDGTIEGAKDKLQTVEGEVGCEMPGIGLPLGREVISTFILHVGTSAPLVTVVTGVPYWPQTKGYVLLCRFHLGSERIGLTFDQRSRQVVISLGVPGITLCLGSCKLDTEILFFGFDR